jgi:ATP adenylyltransferase
VEPAGDRSTRHTASATSGTLGAGAGPQRNPFLPYDPRLFVADVSDRHVALLNKFPVVGHHLLVVTREFEEQESRLTRRDWEALWICLEEGEVLGFYNSGAEAGASQGHRHLQLVPLPLVAGGASIPIAAKLPGNRGGGLAEAPGLAFRNLFARLDGTAALAERVEICEALYADALERQGDSERPAPYNLLVTREWFLYVPRIRGEWQRIAVNALGFAGLLLVRDERGLSRLRRVGPTAVLSEVTGASSRRGLLTDR